ncbi:MAG: hypothetical protein NTV82_02680, partial [Candidatus Aminicenantes bacterium]|nr:hypothetical protein [Candidatus Aminicenantes bacterium]
DNPDTKSELQTQYKEATDRITENQEKIVKLADRYKYAEFYLDKLKLLNDLRPEGGKIWFSSVETTTISKSGPGTGGEKTRSRFGSGGAGLRQTTLGINSTGFPGISSGASESRLGSGGAFGRKGTAAKKTPQQGAPLPNSNGFRIMGYAKDDQALMEFYDSLKKYRDEGSTPQIYDVYFSEANAEPVPITEMELARVADRPIAARSSTSGGTSTERRRGFGSNFSTAVGGPGRSSTPTNLYNPYVEKVVFFKLDIRFQPFPEPPPEKTAATTPFGKKVEGTEGGDVAAEKGKRKNPFSKSTEKGQDKEKEANPLKKSRGELLDES